DGGEHRHDGGEDQSSPVTRLRHGLVLVGVGGVEPEGHRGLAPARAAAPQRRRLGAAPAGVEEPASGGGAAEDAAVGVAAEDAAGGAVVPGGTRPRRSGPRTARAGPVRPAEQRPAGTGATPEQRPAGAAAGARPRAARAAEARAPPARRGPATRRPAARPPAEPAAGPARGRGRPGGTGGAGGAGGTAARSGTPGTARTGAEPARPTGRPHPAARPYGPAAVVRPAEVERRRVALARLGHPPAACLDPLLLLVQRRGHPHARGALALLAPDPALGDPGRRRPGRSAGDRGREEWFGLAHSPAPDP